MGRVATLYVRDVPEKLYKRLRARARRNGRSLNAAVLELNGTLRGIDTAAARKMPGVLAIYTAADLAKAGAT